MQHKTTRRQTLKTPGQAGKALPFLGAEDFVGNINKTPYEVHVFSKHLQWLDYENMAKTASENGFDGVDLTVRPKGHVLPEKVNADMKNDLMNLNKYMQP